MAQEPHEQGAVAGSGGSAGALHVPFTPDRLLLRLRPADRAELVRRLCEALRRAPGVPDEVDLAALVLDALTRDAEGGTVRVGPELVCLHLRRPDVSAVRVAIATLELPMVWTDGEPARVVCLLAAPRDRPVQSLRVFAQLERLMVDPAAVAWILAGRHAPDFAP